MKAAIHYVFLVGIPVLIVFILLRTGENTLIGPASVGGNWLLEIPSQTESASCSDFTFGSEEPMLNISQSGPHLVLTFNDENHTTLAGKLTDLTITVAGSGSSTLEAPLLNLSVTVDRQTEPDRLKGTLTIASCGTTLSLSAIRQPEVAQTSGGH
jgi:hypothetical protein